MRRTRSFKRARLTLALLGALTALAWAAPAQAFDCHGGAGFALQSYATGRYVSAELGWNGSSYGTLRARSSSIGPWEVFRCVSFSNGATFIQNDANRKFVSAELGWSYPNYAILRARATAYLSWWESFSVNRLISDRGTLVTIRSRANWNFVSAEYNWSGDDYGTLRATASSAGSWERFFVRWL